jgi:hypothetical protein
MHLFPAGFDVTRKLTVISIASGMQSNLLEVIGDARVGEKVVLTTGGLAGVSLSENGERNPTFKRLQSSEYGLLCVWNKNMRCLAHVCTLVGLAQMKRTLIPPHLSLDPTFQPATMVLEIGFARWEADKVWDKPSDD